MTAAGQTTAILLAAGRGERIGEETPKQFLDLRGRPVFEHSLAVFEAVEGLESVILVIPDDIPQPKVDGFDKVTSVAIGGETRQASLAAGLDCLPEQTSVVLVHDAARPLIRPGIIEAVLRELDASCQGVVAAVEIEEAVKEVGSDHFIAAARRRSGLWRAQTPQGFFRGPLEEALARADAESIVCEDCSEMLTRAGYVVKVVAGDPWNLKVTRPGDLGICEAILVARGIR